MLASHRGKTDATVLLLDRGANIEAKDNVRFPQLCLPTDSLVTTSTLCRVV
jgi:hypothetical protein